MKIPGEIISPSDSNSHQNDQLCIRVGKRKGKCTFHVYFLSKLLHLGSALVKSNSGKDQMWFWKPCLWGKQERPCLCKQLGREQSRKHRTNGEGERAPRGQRMPEWGRPLQRHQGGCARERRYRKQESLPRVGEHWDWSTSKAERRALSFRSAWE